MRNLLLVICFSLAAGCGGQDLSSVSETKSIGACIRSHVTEQCFNQEVCDMVCGAAGGAAGPSTGGAPGAAAGVALGNTICNQVCRLVPKCSPIVVCDEYERGGP